MRLWRMGGEGTALAAWYDTANALPSLPIAQGRDGPLLSQAGERSAKAAYVRVQIAANGFLAPYQPFD